jgi:hypothetical protein
VVLAIGRLLDDLARQRGGCAVVSPIDVVLADPVLDHAGLQVEPHLLAEIAARGRRREEIVDPDSETFTFLENAPAGFRVRLPEGAVYRSAAVAGLELDLEAFWRFLSS